MKPYEKPVRNHHALPSERSVVRCERGILERRNNERMADEPAQLFEAGAQVAMGMHGVPWGCL